MEERYDPWNPLPAFIDVGERNRAFVNNVVITLNILNYSICESRKRSGGISRFKPDRTERFLGKELGGTLLAFRSGKGVLVGLPGTLYLPLFLAHVQGYLSQVCGHFCPLSQINIQNIVINSQILDDEGNEARIDLNALHARAPGVVCYTPEQFPGARLTLGHYSINLFQSGKYVLPGVKNMNGILEASQIFLHFFNQHRDAVLLPPAQ